MDRTTIQQGSFGPRADAAASAKRVCVLVAEDEDLVRELAIEVLEAHGFEAIAARDGREAVVLFQEHAERIDAVLLDMSMPVMDGASALSEMRKHRPTVRVVVTSGFDDADSFPSTLGRISFLQKPYRGEKLVSQLKTLLEGKDN
jgi:DNA-binding NtrC family response regulator